MLPEPAAGPEGLASLIGCNNYSSNGHAHVQHVIPERRAEHTEKSGGRKSVDLPACGATVRTAAIVLMAASVAMLHQIPKRRPESIYADMPMRETPASGMSPVWL